MTAAAREHGLLLTRYLAPLKGARIVDVEIAHDELGLWPTLRVETADGQRLTIEVSADAEGNGPGFLAGLPPVEA